MEDLKNPGLLPDNFDPRDAWLDEVLGGDEEIVIPKRFRVEGLKYEPQGAYPFCASFATTTLLEYKYSKENEVKTLSQPHLFFHAGGTATGSTFRGNLDVLCKKGGVAYDQMPMRNPKFGREPNWLEEMRAEALSKPFVDPTLLGNYARVQPDAEKLKLAMLKHGPLLIGVYAGGDYYRGGFKRASNVDNHAVLLAGWDENNWIIFDSLWWVEKMGGYGTISLEYPIFSAYAATELPKNWKKQVEKVRSKPFQNALDHYGKQRNVEAEVRFAAQLLDEFKKFGNQSVLDAAGRFWTILINAGVYGGYSLTYYKWGRWYPGDLINFVYHWRRTGEYIFDLNKTK